MHGAGVGSFPIVMIFHVVGRSSQLLDGTERKREKKMCFVVRLQNMYIFFVSLSPALGCSPAVMDGPQHERLSPDLSRDGANPSPNAC